jgi:hypothetical protein
MCVCPNLDTEYFARNKPKPTDLVGRYIPTENTLHFVRDEGGYEVVDTSITLSIDGSFEMVNMPDWWMEPFGKPSGEFDSGKGEWSIERQQEWWELELNFNSEDPPTGLTFIPLVGEAPPYKLWFYVGDPDSGDVMIFEQVIAE